MASNFNRFVYLSPENSWFIQSLFTFMKIWTIKSIQMPFPSDVLSQMFPGIYAWNGFSSRINTVAFPLFLYFLKCSAAVGCNLPKAPLPKTQCKYTLLRRRMILALTSYAVSICASAKENIFACVSMHNTVGLRISQFSWLEPYQAYSEDYSEVFRFKHRSF